MVRTISVEMAKAILERADAGYIVVANEEPVDVLGTVPPEERETEVETEMYEIEGSDDTLPEP